MNRLALSSLFVLPVLASLVGCAAPGEESEDVTGDELRARPRIELKSTGDKDSIQAKLYGMLQTFKGDSELGIVGAIESKSLLMSGGHDTVTRSVSCTKAVRFILPAGASSSTVFACDLDGFEKVRNGGQLPLVDVTQRPKNAPLASKLFSLLEKAEKKGGFDVQRSANQPGCCDMPSSATYAISDDVGTLSCTMHSGGFFFHLDAECSYVASDSNAKVQKGTLVHSVGIGGENTGFSVKLSSGKLIELVLDKAEVNQFVEGRVARVTGAATKLSGVETHDRSAINVTDLLVCPAPHTTFSMMPPVTEDAQWLGANCPDLDIVH